MKKLIGCCLLSFFAIAGHFPGPAWPVVIEHEYDSMNRRILTRYEDGGTVVRAYDPAGNLTHLEKRAANPGGFLEDFEGPLGPEWSSFTSNTAYGRNERSTYAANGGSYAWRMDVTANGQYSLDELVLCVHVNGASYLNLSFATREYDDENHDLPAAFSGHANGDGIAVSNDGTNWKTVWQYPSSLNAWTTFGPIDLSAAVSPNGTVYVKFQQYDNYVIATDGILWDDISLSSDGNISLSQPQPPAEPSTYAEDFEAATGPEWSSYTSNTAYGRNERSTYSANGGSYAWRMDVTANGQYSLDELVLCVQVSGASWLDLSFATREYSDETHSLPAAFSGHANGDGIAVSNDGTNWKTVWQYPSSLNAWTTFGPIDLSAAVSPNGTVYVKFQQYDNYVIATDGILWDDISLSSDGNISLSEPQPPAEPSTYAQDFEAATGPEWSSYTSNSSYGRNERSTYAANGGSYAWRMDVTTSGQYSLNELVLHVKVSGATNLKLAFAAREYNDENHSLTAAFSGHANGDGIAVSNDGTNWKTVWQFPSSLSAWTNFGPIDLAPLVSPDGDVFIKFQQYDNYAIATDGILWDDILLTSDGGIRLP